MLSSTFKKLGVMFDSNLCFASHISSVAFFYLAIKTLISSDAEKPIYVILKTRLL